MSFFRFVGCIEVAKRTTLLVIEISSYMPNLSGETMYVKPYMDNHPYFITHPKIMVYPDRINLCSSHNFILPLLFTRNEQLTQEATRTPHQKSIMPCEVSEYSKTHEI